MDKRLIITDEKTGRIQEFIWDIDKETKNKSDHDGIDFKTATYVY